MDARIRERGELTKILRLTAQLLFGNGSSVVDVQRLLASFVNPTQVRRWHERYCQVNGIVIERSKKSSIKRMPVPPIDFGAVEIEDLKRLTESKS